MIAFRSRPPVYSIHSLSISLSFVLSVRLSCREHTFALEDPRVRAIVIYGSGGKFVAGADISLIQKMQQKS